MSTLRKIAAQLRAARAATAASTGVFLRDVGQGMLEVSHNTLALVGLLLVGGTLFVFSRPDIRHTVEVEALSWLQARQESRATPAEALATVLAEPTAISRATAADPTTLSRQQAAVAQWISRRYKVAPEPISRLVQEAWHVGERAGLDPTLILAVMAIESGFNPFAQSPVGAQGLMQVMTRVHDDKYEPFGGTHAAFDPVTNLRVGVQVLKECIQRAGSLEAGLRYYVGAANLEDDGGYATKVLAAQEQLRLAATGRAPATAVRTVAPAKPAVPLPASPAAPAEEQVAQLVAL